MEVCWLGSDHCQVHWYAGELLEVASGEFKGVPEDYVLMGTGTRYTGAQAQELGGLGRVSNAWGV